MRWVMFLVLLLCGFIMESVTYRVRGVVACGGQGGSGSFDATLCQMTVGGKAGSGSFRCVGGPVRIVVPVQSAVVIDAVERRWLAAGESATITWHSRVDGDFYVEVGGNGTPGSGVLLDSGTLMAGAIMQHRINEADLPDNAPTAVYFIVSTATRTSFASILLYDDQLPPSVELHSLHISGHVDDPTVTEVLVDGVPVPVQQDGRWSADVGSPPGEIIIEAQNSKGIKVTRKITIR